MEVSWDSRFPDKGLLWGTVDFIEGKTKRRLLFCCLGVRVHADCKDPDNRPAGLHLSFHTTLELPKDQVAEDILVNLLLGRPFHFKAKRSFRARRKICHHVRKTTAQQCK